MHDLVAQTVIPECDALRAVLIALRVSISTVLPDWPTHLDRVIALASKLVSGLEYGPFSTTETFQAAAADYTGETFRQITEALIEYERDNAAGNA